MKVKAAQVAVAARRTDPDGNTTSSRLPLISLIRSFDSVLAAYEGFCSLKQVVVRNVPSVGGHSISESVDTFFRRNHPDHYLGHQAVYNANKFAKLVKKKERLQNWLDYNQLKFERNPERRPTRKRGFLGLWGERVDSVSYYKEMIDDLENKIASERQRILKDPKAVLPVAFVTFDSRWAAAVCAQTQQSKNPTQWLTEWAPEPRDVYWQNLAIPFVSLSFRRLVISLLVFAHIFFYMIPIAFVQSLANLEALEKVAPFLRPVIELSLMFTTKSMKVPVHFGLMFIAAKLEAY